MYEKLFGQIILFRPRFGQKAQNCSKVVVFMFEKPGSVLHLGHNIVIGVLGALLTHSNESSDKRTTEIGSGVEAGAAFDRKEMYQTSCSSNAAQLKHFGRF